MAIKAGFSEIDITPPTGTHKIGWLIDIVGDKVLDPLFARAAVFVSGDDRIAFIQLDTLSIRWTQVNDIRQRITKTYGFPGENIMVAATHNHAGPAVASTGEVKRDEAYIEELTRKIVLMFGKAIKNLQRARLGFGHTFEWDVGYNRRVVMRDGTTKTHGMFSDPDALHIEGPIDPEVAVVAARTLKGQLLGILVNFACHPTHHGGETVFSAGFPGVLANEMKKHRCPVTLFLNGASGNISMADPVRSRPGKKKEEAGKILAGDVKQVLKTMSFRNEVRLSSRVQTIKLPYRNITDQEIQGKVRGAQRFVDPGAYDRQMPRVVEKIKRSRHNLAEVQVLFLNECAFAGIPAEYFVEHGLRIKEQTYPFHTLVVSHANGMVGYVPTRQAFERGGYETTFFGTSRLAPEAGDLLADAAIKLIKNRRTPI